MDLKKKSVFYGDRMGQRELGQVQTWSEAEQLCATLRVPLSLFRGAEGPDGFYLRALDSEDNEAG